MNKTVDQLEIKKFSKISYDWWNPDGKFGTLHKINPIRVKFMLDLIFKLLRLSKVSNQLTKNMQLDISYTKSQLNWKPPFNLKESIRKSI